MLCPVVAIATAATPCPAPLTKVKCQQVGNCCSVMQHQKMHSALKKTLFMTWEVIIRSSILRSLVVLNCMVTHPYCSLHGPNSVCHL